MDNGKEVKDPSSVSPVKGVPRTSMMGRTEVNDPPRKGIIRMITGGPIDGDSQRLERPKYDKLMESNERNNGCGTCW
ncbi:UNVERIFIED_CONTAM: hypothetical protein Sradi_6932200 [Sesamum radiatum]|uniref:Uncharacterized protein n=1 Tax=Sesamum radiatum TaxID=300843 RepID=A0AAW2JIW9_SESRA